MAVVEESWRHGVEHTAVAWYSNRLLGGDGVRECVGAPKTFIAQPAAQITDERRSILRAQINSLPLLFPIPGFETQPRGRAENARRFVTAGAIFDSGSCMIDAYDVCVRCEGASSHWTRVRVRRVPYTEGARGHCGRDGLIFGLAGRAVRDVPLLILPWRKHSGEGTSCVSVFSLVPSLIEGLRVVQGLRVVPVFLYRCSMKNQSDNGS